MRSDISERWASYVYCYCLALLDGHYSKSNMPIVLRKKAVSRCYKPGVTFEHSATLLLIKPMEFLNG